LPDSELIAIVFEDNKKPGASVVETPGFLVIFIVYRYAVAKS